MMSGVVIEKISARYNFLIVSFNDFGLHIMIFIFSSIIDSSFSINGEFISIFELFLIWKVS